MAYTRNKPTLDLLETITFPENNDLLDAQSKLNIIFIHGINGHPYETWGFNSHKDFSKFIKDYLKIRTDKYQYVSIHTYGYNSKSKNNIDIVSKEFKSTLQGIKDHDTIIVAHSLGGIITKNTLNNIMLDQSDSSPTSIQGVLFFGTPHFHPFDNTKLTGIAKMMFLLYLLILFISYVYSYSILAIIVSIVLLFFLKNYYKPSFPLLNLLLFRSEKLEQISNNFKVFFKDIDKKYFSEGKEKYNIVTIVSEKSSTLNSSSTTICEDNTHNSMVRLNNKSSCIYATLLDIIEEIIKDSINNKSTKSYS